MKNEDLEKIKKWLPRGYAKRINLETGISFVTIYATMNGKSKNKAVLDAAVAIAKEEKERVENMQDEVSSFNFPANSKIFSMS